jgi:gas vesicle protein GvpK
VTATRIDTNPDTIEKDVARLVLALVDLVRQLMERQAVRRVDAGSLSDDEVERMGETFLKLDRRMAELRTAFGLEAGDLDLNLGQIRELL